MATITFRLSAKTDSQNFHQVLVRFFHGKTIDQFAKTNIFAPSKYWDEENQCVLVPRFRLMTPEKQDLIQKLTIINERVANLKSEISAKYKETMESKRKFKKDWLKQVVGDFDRKGEKLMGFFDVFSNYIENHQPMSDHRRSQFWCLWRCLKRFSLYEGEDLSLDEITPETLKNFREWLRDEHLLFRDESDTKYQGIFKEVSEKRPVVQRGHNTIVSTLRMLRAFILDCVKDKNIPTTNNPFEEFSIGSEEYTTPYFLDWSEVQSLFAFDLSDNPQLAIQRDIFVFQCCVGCRVEDLMSLRPEDVIDGELCYIPQKTRKERQQLVTVPLRAEALTIVERYKGGKKLLPFSSPQRYNIDIKSILSLAKINRKVSILNTISGETEQVPICTVASSHMARRTFVGNLYRVVQDPNIISEMSGHCKNSRAFSRYMDIDRGIKQSVLNKLGKTSK